ncbi:MAG: hypothetical protein ABIZ04_10660 [Opitutus sp.]
MFASLRRRCFRPLAWCVMGGSLVCFAAAQPRPIPANTATARTTDGRTSPRRAIVNGLTLPVHELRITDLAGQDISAQVEAKSLDGKLSLNLAQPSAIVLKPKAISTMAVAVHGKVTLPGGAVVPLTGMDTPGVVNQAQWFRLTFSASPIPAAWDESAGSYLTQLTFGLQRPADAPASLTLGQPVIVKLGYQGLTAPETTMISLEAAGLENEKTISLHFTPQSPKPTILVRSSISDVNLELTAIPRLAVQPERTSILGLGLDVVAVTITRIEPDGRSLSVNQDTPVTLSVEGRARVEPSAFVLPAGSATTRFAVRSSGLGRFTIRASADGVAGSAVVGQTFPTGALVAAILGGALGGFSRRFIKGSRSRANARRIGEGVIVAVIVFVAGVLGVGYLNLPAAVVATEAGAFLTGALAGFAGVSVFEKLAQTTVTQTSP